jgi:hypothetical protein
MPQPTMLPHCIVDKSGEKQTLQAGKSLDTTSDIELDLKLLFNFLLKLHIMHTAQSPVKVHDTKIIG